MCEHGKNSFERCFPAAVKSARATPAAAELAQMLLMRRCLPSSVRV